MLRFLVVAGLLALAGYLLYLIFAFEHDGAELAIMIALLAAGLCLTVIVLLLKRRHERKPDMWDDGFDDGL